MDLSLKHFPEVSWLTKMLCMCPRLGGRQLNNPRQLHHKWFRAITSMARYASRCSRWRPHQWQPTSLKTVLKADSTGGNVCLILKKFQPPGHLRSQTLKESTPSTWPDQHNIYYILNTIIIAIDKCSSHYSLRMPLFTENGEHL